MAGQAEVPDAAAAAADFPARLVAWQRRHGRHDLPWQNTRDPYRIWLSEIMLQQTQVTTASAYYERFLARFPDLAALARAPIEAVLESWAGLGYYARARNLHRCAQTLCADHGGKFPEHPEAIAALPGIGRSTAAAIAVFAFAARAAILDGNVKRVLCRYFAIDAPPREAEKKLWQIAETLVPDTDCEAYAQGLMDLGATLCTRARPACERCPLARLCLARRQGREHELPVAAPRKALPERQAKVIFLVDGKRVLLERRPPVGIWGGLLGAPEMSEIAPAELAGLARRHGCLARQGGTFALPRLSHSFTHFRLHIDALVCAVDSSATVAMEKGWEWLAYEEIETAALPTPIRALLRTFRRMQDRAQ